MDPQRTGLLPPGAAEGAPAEPPAADSWMSSPRTALSLRGCCYQLLSKLVLWSTCSRHQYGNWHLERTRVAFCLKLTLHVNLNLPQAFENHFCHFVSFLRIIWVQVSIPWLRPGVQCQDTEVETAQGMCPSQWEAVFMDGEAFGNCQVRVEQRKE